MTQKITGDVEQLIVKLTYLGIQDKPVPSLLLSARKVLEPLEMLRKYALIHTNDEYGITNIVIAPARLQKVVDLVEKHADSVAEESLLPVLGIALVVKEGHSREFQLASADAATFFDRLHQELSGDGQAVTQFEWWRARTNL